MLAETPPSGTLMPNPHYNSPALPHFQWVCFQGWLNMKRAMGLGGSEPMPEHLRIAHLQWGYSCSPPQAPEPVPASRVLGSPGAAGPGLAALGWPLLCHSALCGIKRCWHVPAKANEHLLV